MKKKLLTLLTLLLAVCSGAWADETIFLYQYDGTSAYGDGNNGEFAMSATIGTAKFVTYEKKTTGSLAWASWDSSVTDSDLKPSSVSTNKKALKLGNNAAHIKITPKSGNFKAGDIIYICGFSPFLVTTTTVTTPSTTAHIVTPASGATTIAASVTTGSDYNYLVGSVILPNNFEETNAIYISRVQSGSSVGVAAIKVVRPSALPAAISFNPAAGTVAEGSTVTLTSSGATSIVYKWSSAAIGSEGDWTGAETYSGSNKPVVPVEGSSNTVLSVKATNANGSTYGSASYTPVKMASKTIYSIADGIGSAEMTAADATVNDGTSLVLSNTSGRIKLTAASGFQFKNGDAISFSGTIGKSSKAYGIKYGPTTDLGTNLYVAAGEPCNVSGTLTLASATSDLYIGRYDGSTTTMTSFVVRQQMTATSITYTGVKISGSASTEGEDYSKEGTVITLDGTFATAPNVALTNHIVFTDASEEDQDVDVVFGAPDGEYFTGTATIDGTTYTVKAPCAAVSSLKVQYKLGDVLIKEETLDTPEKNVGATHTVPFRMYVTNGAGTALYYTSKEDSDPFYGKSVTLTANTVLTRDLTEYDLEGGTIELIEDFDGSTENYGGVRGSNCSTYNSSAYTSTNNLPAGEYKFIIKAYNRGRGSSVKVGDTKIFDFTEVGGSWTDKEFTGKIIPTAGKLTFVAGGSSTYDPIDILIAIRQAAPATVSMPISAAEWASFSSVYEVAIPAGVTAYYASEGNTSTVKLKTIDGSYIPANTGVIVAGAANTYNATVTATDATLGETNLLKPWLTAGTPSEETYYTLAAGPVFKQSTGGTLAAGKAYLVLPDAARELSIVFDDETTGISATLNDKGQMTNDKVVYNLSGQRIAKPTKGLYIKNGKKVIVK